MTAKILLTGTLLVTMASQSALAKSWKRTDKQAKIIANKINQLEDSIEKVAQSDSDDDVSKRDNLREKITMAEVDLVDALQTVLFDAYQSDNQPRFMKRLAKNLSASQLAELQKILDVLNKNKSWMTDEYATDFIEKETERLARKEILSLRDKFQKHGDKSVAALVRIDTFN